MLPKLFFISLLCSSLIFTHSYSQCLDHQKSLLLQLKNELIFDSSRSTKLVQWNPTDDECCNWYGVECVGTGYVVSLQLDDESISGGIGDSSSLFKLEHLEKLNLANNKFNSIQIPRGIHTLTSLTHLNLSNAVFTGQVPAEIMSLRRLVSLDISNEDYEFEPIKLEYPNLETLLQNLTRLRHLYLDSAYISSDEKTKWSHIVSSYIPEITSLSLVSCHLSGPPAPSFWQLRSLSFLRLDDNDLSSVVLDFFASFPNLATLSLVFCSLNSSFPRAIFHIPTLRNLDLSDNKQLSGSIPEFTQTGSLESIMLSYTNFSGSVPSSISNLNKLSVLDLSDCRFTGSIPSTFANLTQLAYVYLSNNFFTGSLPSTLFESLSNLVYFSSEYNSFNGNIPKSLFGLSSLKGFDLSYNQFTGLVEELPIVYASNLVSLNLESNRLEGPIPNFFFQFHSLEYLLLSGNLFTGTFQPNKIQTLANLTYLDLSGNNLSIYTGNDNSSSHGLPQLRVLKLVSCNLYEFPYFIKHYDTEELDLSNNQIAGEIPSWIWRRRLKFLNLSLNLLTSVQKPFHIPASLQLLDLHSNKLGGELDLPIPPNIGNLTPDLRFVLLANNSFNGSIPTSLCGATKLASLDLSYNKLSGNIPPCLLNHTKFLTVLHLGRNSIHGHIPDSFPVNCSIQYLDLNNNTLEGKIPNSLKNCRQLEFLNIGNNIINGTFPCMLPSSLRVLVLHSNSFRGELKCRRSWPVLQVLDISSNDFVGSLESTNFSSWEQMVAGNDAQVRQSVPGYYSLQSFGIRLVVKGLDVQLVKIWSDFTAIDFSGNNFVGEIPNALGELRSLHYLNFSHNALNGSIPHSLGKMEDLESLDLSANKLEGAIPKELAKLTFLSVLNLSYNKLVGEIPNGRQLQTFSADSFEGNPGLCGFNLNISCSSHTSHNNNGLSHEEAEAETREVEWEYVSTALGYVVGLGSIVWLLLFCRSFRDKYFDKVDEVVVEIIDGRDRRRRQARRAAVRNRVR